MAKALLIVLLGVAKAIRETSSHEKRHPEVSFEINVRLVRYFDSMALCALERPVERRQALCPEGFTNFAIVAVICFHDINVVAKIDSFAWFKWLFGVGRTQS